jgi:hypothetical protein
MRTIILMTVLVCVLVPMLNAQTAQNDSAHFVATSCVVSTATTTAPTNIRVADPNEPVVVNGRVMKVSEYLAVLSSLDNLEAQRLHNPETSNHEKVKPTVLPQQTVQSCPTG